MHSRGKLKNNSRKPRDLTKNRYSDSLKKGQLNLSHDVAVDDDDDAMRTSVSQTKVTATLCTEESFFRIQHI
jgi:hypothetical protein